MLGITSSTFFIRSRALVGAGFFWLMSGVNVGFAFLSVISSSNTIRILCVSVLVFSLLQLAHVIAHRNQVKEKQTVLDVTQAVFLLAAIVVTMIAIVHEDITGTDFLRESVRGIVGGLLLGGVTTAMLLGHWYLVQPGLARKPIADMCQACLAVLFVDIVLWLIPTSMVSVIRGTVSDGWGGTLGYMWLGSCVTTAVLLVAAQKALQEKSYSAVMATTGLLYLAILVANGVELIPRAIYS